MTGKANSKLTLHVVHLGCKSNNLGNVLNLPCTFFAGFHHQSCWIAEKRAVYRDWFTLDDVDMHSCWMLDIVLCHIGALPAIVCLQERGFSRHCRCFIFCSCFLLVE